MMNREEPYLAGAENDVEPFKPGAGFFAFIVLACLPAMLAVSIFLGAWVVSGEVEAAEHNATAGAEQPGVDPWKKTLVGLCPVH